MSRSSRILRLTAPVALATGLVGAIPASAYVTPHRYTNTSTQIVQLTYHSGCTMQGNLFMGDNKATTVDNCGLDKSYARHYWSVPGAGGWTGWVWSYGTATSSPIGTISSGEHYDSY